MDLTCHMQLSYLTTIGEPEIGVLRSTIKNRIQIATSQHSAIRQNEVPICVHSQPTRIQLSVSDELRHVQAATRQLSSRGPSVQSGILLLILPELPALKHARRPTIRSILIRPAGLALLHACRSVRAIAARKRIPDCFDCAESHHTSAHAELLGEAVLETKLPGCPAVG